jgi:hypothetical protein
VKLSEIAPELRGPARRVTIPDVDVEVTPG